MKILSINKDNEVLEIHHSVNGYFLIMGTKGKTTEMNLSSEDVASIKSAFTKSRLDKKPKYKITNALKNKPNNW